MVSKGFFPAGPIRVLAILLLTVCAAICAANNVRAEGSTVVLNEVPVLTLRATIGKSGPAARAKILAARLSELDTLDLKETSTRRQSKLYANGTLIILINQAEAAAHGVSQKALGSAWLVAIRRAWNLPAIQLNKSSLTLPPGGKAAISAVGRLARSAPWATEDTDVVSVSRTGAELTFTARGVGSTTVTVGENDDARVVKVKVLPYAATFPQTVSAVVVGAPASANTVRGVIEGALNNQLKTFSGCKVTCNAVPAGEIGSGEKKTFSVHAVADGADAFRSEGVVNVSVTNLPIAQRRESELWYCNDPENVRRPQALFGGLLHPDRPVRMLYHHINVSGQGLFFRVLAVNEGDRPASVVIIPGDSKDRNPVLAGVMAADPFFRAWLTGSGEVVTIPPGAGFPIAFRRLAPQETSSGLCYLRLLPGGSQLVKVTAEAVTPYEIDAKWLAAQQTPTPWREVGVVDGLEPTFQAPQSDQVFPDPFKDESFRYRVGGNFSFFQIGFKPIQRERGHALDGNFGVVYNIQAVAENPTGQPADVELVFESSAGYSGALFALDGDVVRLPLLPAKTEARLVRFRLEPGASKTINITTIPLSGSSYPATLVLRPVSNLPKLGG